MSKRAHLLENEAKIRALWQETRIFEANPQSNRYKDKFFCTFPVPYMNGRLHIGHGFSLSKSEFQARFQRTQNKNVLWPFGLHCTGILFISKKNIIGMPIMACADKIKNELYETNSGLLNNRKVFSHKTDNKDDPNVVNVKDVTKFKSTKSKLVSKTNVNLTQFEIMRQMNIDEAEIPKFADPDYWLTYFPPLAIQDMKLLGLSVDWRRTFTTTNRNPYYNLFVEWQFDRLKKLNKLLYGCRPSILSRVTMQPCTDHDRSEGEGATSQEYTVVKLKLDLNVKNPFKPLDDKFKPYASQLLSKPVYMLAATLRPETFYGQTNLFVAPEGEYEAFLGYEAPKLTFNSVGVVENKFSLEEAVQSCECLYVTSRRSAMNLAHQGLTILNKESKVKTLDDQDDLSEDELFSVNKFTGLELIGTSVVTPLSVYKSVYVVPMVTANMNKGTGVVACVPSDSPDDYVILSELRRKSGYFKEKYNVEEEYVKLDVVPIIDVPEYGTCMAVKLCDENKVTSSKEYQKLEELKEFIYKKGYYTGVIKCGPYTDQKVVDVKNKIRDDLVANKQAFMYYEPSKLVVSRSGDVCVVAICNQWYTKFGDEEWKKSVLNYVHNNNFTCYNESTLNQIKHTIQWLDNWACSRSYGLGTYLPWEDINKNKNILIESISDSTIYMAYYTICHYLQSDIFGSKPGLLNMKPEQLDYSFFNYVFKISDEFPRFKSSRDNNKENNNNNKEEYNKNKENKENTNTNTNTNTKEEKEEFKVTKELADVVNKMRDEFGYWYPMDVRCSGKDLLFNHLPMCLFIHEAIWKGCDFQYMPRSYFCNGHVLLGSEKMSKSKGNFLTMEESVQLYTADGTRIALADAGDSLDDANFSRETAESSILKLYNFLQTCQHDLLKENEDNKNKENTTNTKENKEEEMDSVDNRFNKQLNFTHNVDNKECNHLVNGDNESKDEKEENKNKKLKEGVEKNKTNEKLELDELELNELIESNDLKHFTTVAFENEIKYLCDKAKESYENFVYRDALKAVFYDYITIRLDYLQLSNYNTNYNSLYKYYRAFCVIANPIVPHMCEYIWNFVLNMKEPLTYQLWPHFQKPTNYSLHQLLKLLYRNLDEFRKIKEKSQSGKKGKVVQTYDKAVIYVSKEYPEDIKKLLLLLNEYNIIDKKLSEKEVLKKLNESELVKSFNQKEKKTILGFASYQLKQLYTLGTSVLLLKLPYNELKLYSLLTPFLKATLSVQDVKVMYNDNQFEEDTSDIRQTSFPGKPSILYYN